MQGIVELIGQFAAANLMLPVTEDFLFEHISNYHVAETEGKLVGCVFLRVYNDTLAEVRSLAVDKSYQKQGTGRNLVLHLVEAARELGIRKLFALTVTPRFFEKIGFHEVDKVEFPEKIWHDCDKCSKRDQCDEIAFVMELGKR